MTHTTPPISSPASRDPSSAQRRMLDDQAGFAAVLSRANDSGSLNPSRDAAEKLVAVAFVQPVLAKMRESGSAAAPFHPNAAEKSFRGIMDSALAQKIVKSSNWPLVDRIEAKLKGDSPAQAQAAMRAQTAANRTTPPVSPPNTGSSLPVRSGSFSRIGGRP